MDNIIHEYITKCINFYKNNGYDNFNYIIKKNIYRRIYLLNDNINNYKINLNDKLLKKYILENKIIDGVFGNFFIIIKENKEINYFAAYHEFFYEMFNNIFTKFFKDFIRININKDYKHILIILNLNINKILNGLINIYNYCKNKYIDVYDVYTGGINILSYNIDLLAITGNYNKSNKLCYKQNETYNNICLKNLKKFLKSNLINNTPDFIFLQEYPTLNEYYDFQTYIDISIESLEVKYIYFKNDNMKKKYPNFNIITYWNSFKFKLDKENNFYYDIIDNLNFLALFFDNWLCVINILNNNQKFDINLIFNTIKEKSNICYDKIKKYQIIIGGFFNNNLKNKSLKINDINKNLIGITNNEKFVTCCNDINGMYDKNLENNNNKNYDHILVSIDDKFNTNIYNGAKIINTENMISSHAPIFANLQIKGKI